VQISGQAYIFTLLTGAKDFQMNTILEVGQNLHTVSFKITYNFCAGAELYRIENPLLQGTVSVKIYLQVHIHSKLPNMMCTVNL
jgi:hypothetical protein